MTIFQGVHGGQGKKGKLDGIIILGVHRGHPECAKCKNRQQRGRTTLDKKIKYHLRATNADLIELESPVLGCPRWTGYTKNLLGK